MHFLLIRAGTNYATGNCSYLISNPAIYYRYDQEVCAEGTRPSVDPKQVRTSMSTFHTSDYFLYFPKMGTRCEFPRLLFNKFLSSELRHDLWSNFRSSKFNMRYLCLCKSDIVYYMRLPCSNLSNLLEMGWARLLLQVFQPAFCPRCAKACAHFGVPDKTIIAIGALKGRV